MVVEHGFRRELRFRNGLLETIFRGLRRADLLGLDPNLTEIARLQDASRSARSIPDLLKYISDAWTLIGGRSGRAHLLLCADDGRAALAVDELSVTRLALAGTLTATANGREIHTYAERIGVNWVLHTQWPEPEKPVVLRICLEDNFSPNVATREVLRLWNLFVKPLGGPLLQLGLQGLGRYLLKTSLNGGIKKIFVSSTYKDLMEHRRAVMEQLVRRDFLFRGMEHFGATPENLPPAEKIVREVHEADVYLGIFGARYGFVDPVSGLSMTELEFNEAEKLDKPKLLYVLHEDADVKRSDLETDPEKQAKLRILISRIRSKYVIYQFSTVAELAKQVYEDLGKL